MRKLKILLSKNKVKKGIKWKVVQVNQREYFS